VLSVIYLLKPDKDTIKPINQRFNHKMAS